MNLTGKFFLLTILLISAVQLLPAQQAPEFEIRAEIVNGSGSGYLLRAEYDFPEGFHQTLQENFFKFEITAPDYLETKPVNYPDGIDEGEVINYYGRTVIEAELLNFDPADTSPVTVKAFWQLCNEEGMCLFPQSKEITASAAYNVIPPDEPEKTGFSTNILFILFLSFLGGLLLNVMPCVLPVLSIKALSLVKQGGEDKKQILFSSFLYTLGILVSLLALAAVVIIIKASGEQVGWGFQFQNRGFVLVLLTIIFVFALSLFEVFTISAPVMRTGSSPVRSGRSSAGSHFFSGIIAVLLATPCTAPFLGTAAGFAFSQTAPVIIGVFLMVGLGLAFPFILIGLFPSFVSRLPKPGAWMNTFREIMGFLLIGTSVWLIDVLIYQSEPGFLTRVLVYLTALTVAAWLYGRLSSPGASTKRRLSGLAAAVMISAVSAFLLLGNGQNPEQNPSAESVSGSQYSGWLEFSPETVLENAGGDRSVFVAFGAKWCMTCRTNESTVIFTDEITQFFEENNTVLIHGDYTNKNPEIDDWMKNFGRAGVPFYTWYPAGSVEAVLLPEIITRRMITGLSE